MIPASHFQQRQDTGAGLALTYTAQALLYEDPVVVIQGYHIRNRSQGHKIKQAAEVWLRIGQATGFPELFAQRREHVEHHANAGGVLAKEGATRLIGIDDGIGIRKFLARQVMIGNHHRHAQLPGGPDTLNGGYAVVDRDHQVRKLAFLTQTFDDTRGQAVTVCEPAGNAKINTL